MKFLTSLAMAAGAIVLFHGTAWAQSASRQIPASYAQGQHQAPLQELKLWSGYGLSLSFIPTGEVIQKVWLDNPSAIGMDFDQIACRGQADCQTGATVINLRRITPISFPALITDNNSTTLKVITHTSDNQRHLYQFRVVLSSGTPDYVTVEIMPDRAQESMTTAAQKTKMLTDLQTGLQIAERKGQITRRQPLWQKVQQFKTAVQQGISLEQAARQVGVSLPLVHKLVELGQIDSSLVPMQHDYSPAPHQVGVE
ncbi:hypothetical protein BST81_12815 [Leptolyngbya sp. 'hensonii']|uniref:hypothetical protein n=1 Tax=Leptolyngbya sp. 'hensonii' TaxID=1922337 RepID=UPI00094FE051|nr:hypothetical protein [Leptolyngbya sp. 'hensonii']OLP17932.1 hypothetical protein BST81_12815 [Leptolyngbya sp. 'hensonii']